MKKNILITLFVILTLMLITFSDHHPVLALETNQGAKTFTVYCAGCHPHGSNIVRRGKNLTKRALKRNGVDSVEAIAYLVTNGKNNMSAFKDRLTEKQIKQVAAYVLQQAENNWK
jgi:cytochrome c6